MSVATQSGTRYPTLGFITGGTGQSDEGIQPQPYETYAYDSALLEAKIEDFNIVKYSSVLPPNLWGNIYPVSSVTTYFYHGAVLEVIMAGGGIELSKNKAIVTGLGLCWALNAAGYFVGGYAAEYIQAFDQTVTQAQAELDAKKNLTESLNHELSIRNMHAYGGYQFYVNYLNPTQKYGYCMTVLGFLNFAYTAPVGVLAKPDEPAFLTD